MKPRNGKRPKPPVEPIAIIGMRGRFPGATDLDQYWHNLANGVESIATLSADEMRAAGVPDHITRLPGYVNASPVLNAIDEFDAEFFGFSARDAALTDPQQRTLASRAREVMGTYRDVQDLIQVGAYVRGSDPKVDEAVGLVPALETFVKQPVTESTPVGQAWARLAVALKAK